VNRAIFCEKACTKRESSQSRGFVASKGAENLRRSGPISTVNAIQKARADRFFRHLQYDDRGRAYH